MRLLDETNEELCSSKFRDVLKHLVFLLLHWNSLGEQNLIYQFVPQGGNQDILLYTLRFYIDFTTRPYDSLVV